MSELPPVCDYEGSDYRTRFWENQGRDYEDRVERIALRKLMPKSGSTLIDIGAGFGRLANEYDGYEKVVLLDYSSSLLREARDHIGDDPRFVYVAANWYQMPFVSGLFETLVQVRTLHHAAEAPRLIGELGRIARPGGTYVLEFANKQNLKAMLRYAVKKQDWSPYTHEPIEFVKLNFDFHPTYIRETLQAAGFVPRETLSVSHFRIPFLKRTMPTGLLAGFDRVLQPTGRWLQVAPSIFTQNQNPSEGSFALPEQFFACPECHQPIEPENDVVRCDACDKAWAKDRGVYNFKEPI